MASETKFDWRVRTAQEFVDKYGAENEFYTTTLYPDRASWLEGRKGHLGASDAYKVLDTEQRAKLFDELTGKREHENLDGVELVQRGVAAEPFVRNLMPVENPDWEFYDGGTLLFVSKRKPFMSATLDTLAVNRVTGETAIIEQKECPWSAKWKGDFAPDNYFMQCCHQHFVTGIDYCCLHPRIYLQHENGFVTSFERSYEWDMTAPEVAEQVAALVAEEEVFWDELQAGRKVPRLNLPSLF